ncbi:MAG: TetR family transcriptional regulator [Frankiales bacterium]|nr:TetR family transcriptional regulator [Frankiales bacterium]
MISRIIDVLLAEGFLDLSLEDVARKLRCSKSTLYTIESSKEQLLITVIRAFFRRAAERIELDLAASDDSKRIQVYLMAISRELAPASPAFFADLDAFPPTREIYRSNTRIAAERVRQLVVEAVPQSAAIDPTFLGAVAGQIMEAIHRGDIEADSHLDDSAAYRALATLIAAGVSASTERDT